MSNTEIIVGFACFGLQFAASIGALAYGYGILGNTVKRNCETITENRIETREDTMQLFDRMRAIESLAGRLEEAAQRWEKIMSNGINTKISDIQNRLARLEQHCKDRNERRDSDKA